MKTKIKIVALFFMFFAVTISTPQKAYTQGVSISFQVFYDELSPYGNWVFNPDYGYVWLPDVAPGFFPYATDGYWVFTDDGWTWASYYPWGWAPFHYGRWFIDPFYGPMWVPGYEWGPGWVVWRSSGDYYGWAPMGPGVTFSVAYGPNYYVPYDCWRFVRYRDFGRPYVYNYYVDRSRNVTIINNSTVINNIYVDNSRNVTYNMGPDRHEVERHSGMRVNPVAIRESSKPVQELKDNQLVLYKPRVEKTDAIAHKPAPSKVVNLEKTRPAAGKTADGTKQKSGQPEYQKQVEPQHGNISSKPEAARQPQQGKPAGRTDIVNQKPYGNSQGKTEAVKPQQHGNPAGKSEAVKPQQHGNPAGKSEAVKPQQRGNPSGKTEIVNQKQDNTQARADVVKQHDNPKGKSGVVNQPQQSKPAGKPEASRQSRVGTSHEKASGEKQYNTAKTSKGKSK